MDMTTWLTFVLFALVAIITPGPAILLSLSNSIRFGMQKVLLSSLGNICGLLIISSAAILGLGAVFRTSTTLFLLVKIVGALYLVYLGIRQWRSSCSILSNMKQSGNNEKSVKSNSLLFVEGFLIALTNPKAILFFTALFPQFIHTEEALLPQFLIMTTTFMSISFMVLISYGLLANKVKAWFKNETRTRWLNRILGGLFISLGIGVLKMDASR